MPERLECEVPQKVRYINTLTYLPTYLLITKEKVNDFENLHKQFTTKHCLCSL